MRDFLKRNIKQLPRNIVVAAIEIAGIIFGSKFAPIPIFGVGHFINMIHEIDKEDGNARKVVFFLSMLVNLAFYQYHTGIQYVTFADWLAWVPFPEFILWLFQLFSSFLFHTIVVIVGIISVPLTYRVTK